MPHPTMPPMPWSGQPIDQRPTSSEALRYALQLSPAQREELAATICRECGSDYLNLLARDMARGALPGSWAANLAECFARYLTTKGRTLVE